MALERGQALTALSPEAQVLLRTAGGPANDRALRLLLERDIDWSRLCLLAEQERAAAVVWRRLERVGRPLPPAAAQLRTLALVSEFTLAVVRQRLWETVDALAAAGIQAVLLKGAALAHTVYEDVSERPMYDIDLLVPESSAAAAAAIAQSIGWIPRASVKAEAFRDHQHLPPFDDVRGTGVGLELHTDLFCAGAPFTLRAPAVWERARDVRLAGRRTLVPEVHHQLLHTCVHFAWVHELLSGVWRTVRDIDRICATRAVDWDVFVQLARESRSATCCYWSFRLARAVVGVEVPAEVTAALRPPRHGLLLDCLERHFTLGLLWHELGSPSVHLRHRAWEAGMMPEASGHGNARPWREFVSPDRAPAPSYPVWKAVIAHLRDRRRWTQYLRSVLRPPSASPSEQT